MVTITASAGSDTTRCSRETDYWAGQQTESRARVQYYTDTSYRVSVLVALLNWISETPAQKNASATPGYLSFGMAIMSVGVTYMPLFLPPTQEPRMATGTGAAPPMPQ